ncbi:MAG TPA: hypothetical protein VKE42_07510, partial [Candidatus Cybelea sp.]|nr:hypothetical protein [Candidatus Cybelea sp.]
MSVRRVAIAVTLLAALAGCSNNAKSNAGGSPAPAGTATGAATPDCHGDTTVWALTRTQVYLL